MKTTEVMPVNLPSPDNSTIPLAGDGARWKYLLFIAVAIVGLYAQAVKFDFVTYDDYDLIVRNTSFLADWRNIASGFTTHLFSAAGSEGAYYRPLVVTSFILDYAVWGLNPFGFHLTNILLHVLAAGLLFLLLEKLIGHPIAALIGSLVFAVHPVQVQAVAWVAGRNDVLLGVFVIAMLLSYLMYRSDDSGRKLYFYLAILFYFMAALAKESGAFALLLLPLLDLCIPGKKTHHRKRAYVLSLLPFFGALAVYMGIRVAVFGEIVGAERVYGIDPLLTRILNVPAVVSQYVSMAFVPAGLTVSHPFKELVWLQTPWSLAAWGLTALSVTGAILVWRMDRILGFGAFTFAIGLLPTLNILPVALVVLENRLYVPLIGVAVFTARAVHMLRDVRPQWHVAPGAGAVLVCLLAVLSSFQLPIWKNSEALWHDVIQKSPNDTRSYFNLAGYYYEKGQYDKTVEYLAGYIKLAPTDPLGYEKLRQTYFTTGRYQEVLNVCRRMIALEPKNANRYIETAMLFEQMGKIELAARVYEEGLSAVPDNAELHFQYGLLSERLGVPDRARDEYRRTLELNPLFARAYFGLGNYYAHRQDDGLAIELLEKGVALERPKRNIVELLTYLYRKAGREKDAVALAYRYPAE